MWKVPRLVGRALTRRTGSYTSELLKWDVNNAISGERRSSAIWIIRFLLQANLAG